jgi:hypothetical protein
VLQYNYGDRTLNKTISVLDVYLNKSTTMLKGESVPTRKVKLSLFRWIQLKITGRTFYRNSKLKRWSAPMPFFISYCQACRHYFITHPHGWAQNLYTCPTCEAKLGRRAKIRNLPLGVNLEPLEGCKVAVE